MSPYAVTIVALRRSTSRPCARSIGHCRRSWMTAGTVRTSAAIETRAQTAAPLLQPAPVRAVAKAPDVPNVEAATRDRTRPRPDAALRVVVMASLLGPGNVRKDQKC